MKDQPPRTPKPAPKRKAKQKKPKLTKDGVPKKSGAPKGTTAAEGVNGGRIGNMPFQPTDEQRLQVRNYAKTFPVHGEHFIARLMGISRSTLRNYYSDDMLLGRAEMLAGVGAQMINRAMNANAESAIGELDAQKFILSRLGGWTTKVEVGDKAREPFGAPDLSRLSDEELDEYGRLAAIAEGLDPDEVVGSDDGD